MSFSKWCWAFCNMKRVQGVSQDGVLGRRLGLHLHEGQDRVRMIPEQKIGQETLTADFLLWSTAFDRFGSE
jgi:hypothetical protein